MNKLYLFQPSNFIYLYKTVKHNYF